MNNSVCRVCLNDVGDSEHSLFHVVNGTTMAEKLYFVAGVEVCVHEIFFFIYFHRFFVHISADLNE